MKDQEAMPFYIWLLPVLCGACSYVHHRYPGDENALWLLGSAPGLWIAPFVFLGKAPKAIVPVYIAFALAAVMLVVGWAMDRFQVRRTLWAVAFPVCASMVLACSVLSFPSAERALARNGSWWAYILLSINAGVYLSVMVSAFLTIAARGWKRARRSGAGRQAPGGPDHFLR
jgi:hypothetical protein